MPPPVILRSSTVALVFYITRSNHGTPISPPPDKNSFTIVGAPTTGRPPDGNDPAGQVEGKGEEEHGAADGETTAAAVVGDDSGNTTTNPC